MPTELKKDGSVWTYDDGSTKIVINRKWCKGCEICVEFCPKKVLAMEGEKAVVVALENCSRCLLCELRCPDFAIEVFDLDAGKKPEARGKKQEAGNEKTEG